MKQYYVTGAQGRTEGPLDESYIRLQYAYGVYKPQDMVRAEGASESLPLERVFGAKPQPAEMAKVPVIPPMSRFANPFSALGYMVLRISCYKGRATRREFWMSMLGLLLLSVFVSFLFVLVDIFGVLSESTLDAASRGASAGLLVLGLSVTTRRLHDMGLSGWWQLLRFIFVLGDLVILALCCRKGEAGSNRFGENPLR